MATKMKGNSSAELVVGVVVATCVAVESDPATHALAPTWVAMRDRADALAAKGR
jgi:hypothetical protein